MNAVKGAVLCAANKEMKRSNLLYTLMMHFIESWREKKGQDKKQDKTSEGANLNSIFSFLYAQVSTQNSRIPRCLSSHGPQHQDYRHFQPLLGSSRTEPAVPQQLSWCYQERQKQRNSIWLLGCTLVPAVTSPVQFCVLLVHCGFNFPVLLSLLFDLVNDSGNYFT